MSSGYYFKRGALVVSPFWRISRRDEEVSPLLSRAVQTSAIPPAPYPPEDVRSFVPGAGMRACMGRRAAGLLAALPEAQKPVRRLSTLH